MIYTVMWHLVLLLVSCDLFDCHVTSGFTSIFTARIDITNYNDRYQTIHWSGQTIKKIYMVILFYDSDICLILKKIDLTNFILNFVLNLYTIIIIWTYYSVSVARNETFSCKSHKRMNFTHFQLPHYISILSALTLWWGQCVT